MRVRAQCIGVALHLFKLELRKLAVVYRILPFCHHFFFGSTSSALESLQKKRSVASVAMSLGTFPWGKHDFLVIENSVLYIFETCLLKFTPHHIVCTSSTGVLVPNFHIFFFCVHCYWINKTVLAYLSCHSWSPVLEWYALFPSRSVW